MRQEIHGSRRYCKDCPYFTRKANTLSMHVARLHSNQNNHLCTICYDAFPTQTQLGHHLVNKHSSPTIKCVNPLCSLLFKNTTTQKTHYVRCHLNPELMYVKRHDKTCRCISCGELFTLNSIVYHVSGCSPLSPFSKHTVSQPVLAPTHACVNCPESFPTKAQLAHHVVTLHPDAKIKCEHSACDKTFDKSNAAMLHYVRIHMEKTDLYKKQEDGSCLCLSCDKAFTVNAITYHVGRCSNLSPYSENLALCQIIPAHDIVLNQAEEDEMRGGLEAELEDIPQGIEDELIRELHLPNVLLFEELDDIPDNFLKSMF